MSSFGNPRLYRGGRGERSGGHGPTHGGGGGGGFTCYHCGEAGHKKDNCPKKQRGAPQTNSSSSRENPGGHGRGRTRPNGRSSHDHQNQGGRGRGRAGGGGGRGSGKHRNDFDDSAQARQRQQKALLSSIDCNREISKMTRRIPTDRNLEDITSLCEKLITFLSKQGRFLPLTDRFEPVAYVANLMVICQEYGAVHPANKEQAQDLEFRLLDTVRNSEFLLADIITYEEITPELYTVIYETFKLFRQNNLLHRVIRQVNKIIGENESKITDKKLKANFRSLKGALDEYEAECAQRDQKLRYQDQGLADNYSVDEVPVVGMHELPSLILSFNDVFGDNGNSAGASAQRQLPKVLDRPRSFAIHLNTQFHLLHSDFHLDFKEGLFWARDKLQNPRNVERNHSVKLYDQVQFRGFAASMKGLLAHFQIDMTTFGPNWKSIRLDKRLMTGNVMCVSADRFTRSFKFATIAELTTFGPRSQQSRDRNNPLVDFYLAFEEPVFDYFGQGKSKHHQPHKDANFRALSGFAAVESKTFFLPYQRVLGCLQRIELDRLPPKILEALQGIRQQVPPYVETIRHFSLHGIVHFQADVQTEDMAIDVTDPTHWDRLREWRHQDETKDENSHCHSLDQSQRVALMRMFNDNIALIQGTPGTGKTFIGAKFIQALMKNWELYCRNIEHSSPILVVCFSNHALDSFLLDVLRFTSPDHVTRVGGSSSEEQIKALELSRKVRLGSMRHHGKELVKDVERLLSVVEKLQAVDMPATMGHTVSINNAANHPLLQTRIIEEVFEKNVHELIEDLLGEECGKISLVRRVTDLLRQYFEDQKAKLRYVREQRAKLEQDKTAFINDLSSECKQLLRERAGVDISCGTLKSSEELFRLCDKQLRSKLNTFKNKVQMTETRLRTDLTKEVQEQQNEDDNLQQLKAMKLHDLHNYVHGQLQVQKQENEQLLNAMINAQARVDPQPTLKGDSVAPFPEDPNAKVEAPQPPAEKDSKSPAEDTTAEVEADDYAVETEQARKTITSLRRKMERFEKTFTEVIAQQKVVETFENICRAVDAELAHIRQKADAELEVFKRSKKEVQNQEVDIGYKESKSEFEVLQHWATEKGTGKPLLRFEGCERQPPRAGPTAKEVRDAANADEPQTGEEDAPDNANGEFEDAMRNEEQDARELYGDADEANTKTPTVTTQIENGQLDSLGRDADKAFKYLQSLLEASRCETPAQFAISPNSDERRTVLDCMFVLIKVSVYKSLEVSLRNLDSQKSNLDEQETKLNHWALKNQRIIEATTVGAARILDTLMKLRPAIIVVEECAEVLESHILATLTPYTQHIILIGDHRQLQPKTNHQDCARNGLSKSLLERLVKAGLKHETLNIQRRMHPDISKFTKKYYLDEEHVEIIDHPATHLREKVYGIKNAARVIFVDTTGKGFESMNKGMESPYNAFEAELVILIAKYLIFHHKPASTITIIVGYTGQLMEVFNMAKKHNLPRYSKKYDPVKKVLTSHDGVKIVTVDGYQGEENDFTILSLTRTEKVGFMSSDNRACVMLSRARRGTIIVGSKSLFSKPNINPIWRNAIKLLEDSRAIYETFPAFCDTHNVDMSFDDPKSFQKISGNGGCDQRCNRRLGCGHICTQLCHTDCGTGKCIEPCTRIGHNCSITDNNKKYSRSCTHPCTKKCYEICGLCEVDIKSTLPCGHTNIHPCWKPINELRCTETVKDEFDCGHVIEAECYLWLQKKLADATGASWSRASLANKCIEICNEPLQCGHYCTKRCHSSCPSAHVVCQKQTSVQLLCGHTITCSCRVMDELDETMCTNPCEEKLPCGHVCQNKCGACTRAGGIHSKKCSVLVPKVLPCGHQQNVPCCNQVTEVVCSTPCGKMLKCGHPCVGTCGSCKHDGGHHPCSGECGRNLTCGHQCQANCGKDCPPCFQKCDRRCDHFDCGKSKKHHDCANHGMSRKVECCQEQCKWRCAPGCPNQFACRKKCKDDCVREMCMLRCPKKLSCGHRCVGLCGESCPIICPKCFTDETSSNYTLIKEAIAKFTNFFTLVMDNVETFFADYDDAIKELEDQWQALVIQLHCGCPYFVGELFDSIKAVLCDEEKSVEIMAFKCPNCRAVVQPDDFKLAKSILLKVEANILRVQKKQVQLQSDQLVQLRDLRNSIIEQLRLLTEGDESIKIIELLGPVALPANAPVKPLPPKQISKNKDIPKAKKDEYESFKKELQGTKKCNKIPKMLDWYKEKYPFTQELKQFEELLVEHCAAKQAFDAKVCQLEKQRKARIDDFLNRCPPCIPRHFLLKLVQVVSSSSGLGGDERSLKKISPDGAGELQKQVSALRFLSLAASSIIKADNKATKKGPLFLRVTGIMFGWNDDDPNSILHNVAESTFELSLGGASTIKADNKATKRGSFFQQMSGIIFGRNDDDPIRTLHNVAESTFELNRKKLNVLDSARIADAVLRMDYVIGWIEENRGALPTEEVNNAAGLCHRLYSDFTDTAKGEPALLEEMNEEDLYDLIAKFEKKCKLELPSREVLTSIATATGLGAGHWFTCPNGHLYAIGDCGGAMVESRCPECGAGIGGGHHRLRSDNRFAGNLFQDNARPSWPGQPM